PDRRQESAERPEPAEDARLVRDEGPRRHRPDGQSRLAAPPHNARWAEDRRVIGTGVVEAPRQVEAFSRQDEDRRFFWHRDQVTIRLQRIEGWGIIKRSSR